MRSASRSSPARSRSSARPRRRSSRPGSSSSSPRTPARAATTASGAATCTCAPSAIRRYLGRLSGPLLDRMDIELTMTRVSVAHERRAARRHHDGGGAGEGRRGARASAAQTRGHPVAAERTAAGNVAARGTRSPRRAGPPPARRRAAPRCAHPPRVRPGAAGRVDARAISTAARSSAPSTSAARCT